MLKVNILRRSLNIREKKEKKRRRKEGEEKCIKQMVEFFNLFYTVH